MQPLAATSYFQVAALPVGNEPGAPALEFPPAREADGSDGMGGTDPPPLDIDIATEDVRGDIPPPAPGLEEPLPDVGPVGVKAPPGPLEKPPWLEPPSPAGLPSVMFFISNASHRCTASSARRIEAKDWSRSGSGRHCRNASRAL